MDTTHGAGSGGARPGRAHRDAEADGYTPNPALVVLEHEGALAAGRTLHHARQAATRQARRRVEALRSETAQASSISPSGCSKGFFVAWTLVVDLCVGLLTLCTGCVAGAQASRDHLVVGHDVRSYTSVRHGAHDSGMIVGQIGQLPLKSFAEERGAWRRGVEALAECRQK